MKLYIIMYHNASGKVVEIGTATSIHPCIHSKKITGYRIFNPNCPISEYSAEKVVEALQKEYSVG